MNSSKENIEAIYKFPLPPSSAVDDMRMQIGDRTVVARIKPRDEARAIYDAARAAGHTASLLDQERGETSLDPGDLLMVYSDGVIEAPYGDDEFGDERLVRLVSAERSKGPAAAVSAVLEQVAPHDAVDQYDDVTILALAVQ